MKYRLLRMILASLRMKARRFGIVQRDDARGRAHRQDVVNSSA